jgi:hypothetical protein
VTGLWHACEQPERPVDGAMGWHLGCRACLIKARAAHGIDGAAGRQRARTSARMVALLEDSVMSPGKPR